MALSAEHGAGGYGGDFGTSTDLPLVFATRSAAGRSPSLSLFHGASKECDAGFDAGGTASAAVPPDCERCQALLYSIRHAGKASRLSSSGTSGWRRNRLGPVRSPSFPGTELTSKRRQAVRLIGTPIAGDILAYASQQLRRFRPFARGSLGPAAAAPPRLAMSRSPVV